MIFAVIDDNILKNLQEIDVVVSVVAQDIPNFDSIAISSCEICIRKYVLASSYHSIGNV
jgi:hypothetical protein